MQDGSLEARFQRAMEILEISKKDLVCPPIADSDCATRDGELEICWKCKLDYINGWIDKEGQR